MKMTTKVLLESLMGEEFMELSAPDDPPVDEYVPVHQPALWNSLAIRYCSNLKQTPLYVCPYCYNRACEQGISLL